MWQDIQQEFTTMFDQLIAHIPGITVGLIIIFLSWLIGTILKRTIDRIIDNKWDTNVGVTFLGSVVKAAVILIGVSMALYAMGLGHVGSKLFAGAGISAIIIGFAFKDMAENFLAGIILAINRPFQLKDIIESNGHRGPVKDIDLRNTHIRTSAGKDIYIPNAMIMKSILINYTKDGLYRHQFNLELNNANDFNSARRAILGHLIQQNDILKSPNPNVLVSDIRDGKIIITIMFWINIFGDTPKDETDDYNINEPIKSRMMNECKELLISKGFSIPAFMVEQVVPKNDFTPE